MKHLCIDFDGVIHSYSSGWQGADQIPDEPVPGALEALLEYNKRYEVNIYSSRSKDPAGLKAMQEWLLIQYEKWPLLGDIDAFDLVMNQFEWPTQKPAAWLTIDDRAICFNGLWPSIDKIDNFKPWNKLGPGDEILPDEHRADEYLSTEVVGIVRQILMENNVPTAAFIDDHVKNAIVQRNRLAGLIVQISKLEPGMHLHDVDRIISSCKAILKNVGIEENERKDAE